MPAARDATRLTIGELADAAGMTVRNVRNHQSRGLLPPPVLEARTGYYGPEHLERLRLIRDMQADGFNLEAIRRLLSGSPGSAEGVLGLRRAVTAPLAAEPPLVLTAADLARRFGPLSPETLARAEELGVLVRRGDGRFEAPNAPLLRAAEDAAARGVALPQALGVVDTVRRSCEAMAGAFVELFVRELWRPSRRGAEAAAAVEGLRPVAARAVLALFEQAMTAEAERAFARELGREARRLTD
jgi:DNA-binding transcriptional MerR regulator